MTVDKTSIEYSTESDPFVSLYPHQYALLKTFRKSGDAVATPVWFANENGKLYITTGSTAGKVKRIKNNGRATLTPCDQRGKIIGNGEEVERTARVLPEAEYAHANAVLLGSALRKLPCSRKVDKCGTVLPYGPLEMSIIRARSSAVARV